MLVSSIIQWSFRKTGTMGTLASQAEIGVWFQALGRFCGGTGQYLLKKEIVYAKSCNIVHFWPEMVRNAVYNAF